MWHEGKHLVAGGILGALWALTVSPETAHADFNSGCIAVVVDDQGEGIIDDSGGGVGVIDTNAFAKQFYESHGDFDYDFISLFPNFDHDLGTAGYRIFSEVTGLGPSWGSPDDLRPNFGNTTSAIQGFSYFAGSWLDWPADPNDRIAGNNDSPLSVIAQEFMHRWGAYVRYAPGDTSLLGRQSYHWSYYTNAPGTGPAGGASSLEGNVWTDNMDGSFTLAGAQTDGFSEVDQYLMGLRAPSGVSDFFFIQNPTDPGGGGVPSASGTPFRPGGALVTVNGTRVNVGIDDIISTNGARTPDFASSQKHFRHAFVILARGGAEPAQAEIDLLETYRAAWETYFGQETNGIGSIDACITGQPIDVVFLLDRSGSFNDDLANFKANAGALAAQVQDDAHSTRFGIASFKDFPFHPYGCDGVTDAAPCDPTGDVDFAYQVDLPLTEDLSAFNDAVDTLQPGPGFSGADFPQSQYEALYQVLTGLGRDLAGNGNTTDLGDIPPSDIGHDANRPMYIFLFTDAPFHDKDVEPDYPFAGATTATRADVLAELQNTPVVFGMAARDEVLGTDGDTPALRELTDLTGGAVFNLASASEEFEAFVEQAIEETEPPVENPARLLEKLKLREATLRWDHDSRHGHDDTDGLTEVEFEGTLELRDTVDRDELEPRGSVVTVVSNQPAISETFEFEVDTGPGHHHSCREPRHHHHGHHHDHDSHGRRHQGEVWTAHVGGDTPLTVKLEWLSKHKANFEITGKFDPSEIGVNGRSEPLLQLMLGLGDPLYSRQVAIAHNQWKVLTHKIWRGPNGKAAEPPPDHEEQDAEVTDPPSGMPHPDCSVSVGVGAEGRDTSWPLILTALGLAGVLGRRRRRP